MIHYDQSFYIYIYIYIYIYSKWSSEKTFFNMSGAGDEDLPDGMEVDSASGFLSRTLMVLKGKTSPETRLSTEDLQVLHSHRWLSLPQNLWTFNFGLIWLYIYTFYHCKCFKESNISQNQQNSSCSRLNRSEQPRFFCPISLNIFHHLLTSLLPMQGLCLAITMFTPDINIHLCYYGPKWTAVSMSVHTSGIRMCQQMHPKRPLVIRSHSPALCSN